MLTRLFPIALICALTFAWSAGSRAESITISEFRLVAGDSHYTVSADLELDLTSRLEQALNSGVALHFVVEFELARPRWWWWDEKTASGRLQIRLSYNALLRQYRISTGALHQNFSSLADALRVLSRIRAWPVVERERLRPEARYVAALRMRLDVSQLPKPFQLSALTNRDWTLASDWARRDFTPTADEAASP